MNLQPQPVCIRHLFISQAHNFFGHYGRPPGDSPTVAVEEAVCRQGWGIEGDRFYGYRPEYKGQITFVSLEVFRELCRSVQAPAGLGPEVLRRNVVVEGVDLAALIGRSFRLGGVAFFGTEECRPCRWMDSAVAPGAEVFLRGRGGLRAKVLEDGILRTGESDLWLE
jgi:MOSC domain-containing protein YiiM